MKISNFNSFFHFTRTQRSGIFFLLLTIIVIQSVYYFLDFKKEADEDHENRQWITSELVKDTSCSGSGPNRKKIRPFNPNYITDFKGYQLGMNVREIDRLLQFRKSNRFVNSVAEFQTVTKVSDSLLREIAPYFKFPDWVSNKDWRRPRQNFERKETAIIKTDINQATAEDLKKVYGIGDALSARIVNERSKFGAFVSLEQLNDVYGLSSEVVERLKERYEVQPDVSINKININTATVKELMQLPYFKYPVAKNIVIFRTMHGPIQNIEDLTNISNFPVDRIKIIALYLEF